MTHLERQRLCKAAAADGEFNCLHRDLACWSSCRLTIGLRIFQHVLGVRVYEVDEHVHYLWLVLLQALHKALALSRGLVAAPAQAMVPSDWSQA
jgi:hypothetical protein